MKRDDLIEATLGVSGKHLAFEKSRDRFAEGKLGAPAEDLPNVAYANPMAKIEKSVDRRSLPYPRIACVDSGSDRAKASRDGLGCFGHLLRAPRCHTPTRQMAAQLNLARLRAAADYTHARVYVNLTTNTLSPPIRKLRTSPVTEGIAIAERMMMPVTTNMSSIIVKP